MTDYSLRLDIISAKLDLIFRTICLHSVSTIDSKEMDQYFELNNKLLALKVLELGETEK